MDNRPIGIFDSGLGGLTVLRAIHELAQRKHLDSRQWKNSIRDQIKNGY